MTAAAVLALLNEGNMTVYTFSIPLIVPAQDVNHRSHAAYQNYFVYFYQARGAYLEQFGYTEGNASGCGLIITEANCHYKHELSQDDCVRVYCRAAEMKTKMIRIQYQIKKDDRLCAEGSTTNLYYDYGIQKVVALPRTMVDAIRAYEGLPL